MADLEDVSADADLDPFSPHNAPGVQIVVAMRLYDAVMALLNAIDHDAATALHNTHAAGGIVGSFPVLDLDLDDDSE